VPQVHPSAIVDSQVELEDGVEVGPLCVLRGRVRVGRGTVLVGHVYLQGPLTIGAENVIHPYACLGFAPQDLKYKPQDPGSGLVIGDRNTFREGATVHRATGPRPTRIGNDNLFMAQAHAGHDAVVGNHCLLANSVALAGHVQLDDRVTIGGGGMIHQFCRIGSLAMISGLVGIVKDVPPFCTAYHMRRVGSLNLVGLRRAGLRQHIPALQRAFDLLYRHGHSNRVAADLIEMELGHDPLCAHWVAFIRSSRRGLTPCRGNRLRDEVEA
jgi:UDP-N-acetylglucosamine acyltransferase